MFSGELDARIVLRTPFNYRGWVIGLGTAFVDAVRLRYFDSPLLHLLAVEVVRFALCSDEG